MNLIIALLVTVGYPGQPQIFYYDGNNLTALKTIFLPNLRRKELEFLISSSHELKHASIDSDDVSIQLLDRKTMNALRLSGRWYRIDWGTKLKTGSERHIINLTLRSGKTRKKNFIINVEGNKKMELPNRENK